MLYNFSSERLACQAFESFLNLALCGVGLAGIVNLHFEEWRNRCWMFFMSFQPSIFLLCEVSNFSWTLLIFKGRVSWLLAWFQYKPAAAFSYWKPQSSFCLSAPARVENLRDNFWIYARVKHCARKKSDYAQSCPFVDVCRDVIYNKVVSGGELMRSFRQLLTVGCLNWRGKCWPAAVFPSKIQINFVETARTVSEEGVANLREGPLWDLPPIIPGPMANSALERGSHLGKLSFSSLIEIHLCHLDSGI